MGFFHVGINMKEKNNLTISGTGIITATRKGTRRLGEYQEMFGKHGELIFRGRPIINEGEIVAIIENHNIICNEGLQLVAGFAIDESATYDTGITYCEIGTGSTAPAAGDTTLTTYHGRKAITSASRSNYVATISTFFTAAESTAVIAEAGMWGGGDAAAGQATGLLFSHFLASFNNSGGLYDITITYILTIARG